MQNSVAKKIFAVASAAAMLVPFAAPLLAHAAVHAAGTNVSDSSGTVWMVMPDGTRRAYTSAGAFLSYGFNSWSSVVTASAEDLALPQGSFIPPQDGSIICSDRNDSFAVKGTCYEISNGQKFGFTSAAVFTGLGFSFTNSSLADVSWMTAGTQLLNNTTAAHLPGSLVNNNGTVQLMGTSGLLGIPDVATFNSWGYSFGKVVPANAADKAMTQTGVMATRVAGQLSPTALANTGCTSNCGTPVINGTVTASLSSDTPAAGTLVSAQTGPGQTGADLAHFTLTGSGTVTQIVINRIGVSADTSLNNVYLYQGNNRITDAGTFSSGKVSFSNSNGLFTVSGSTEISVRVDVASGISGQTVGAQLGSFTVANGSPMTTSISGNLFQIAQVNNLATVQLSGTSNTAIQGPGTSINAGTMNTILWSDTVNVGQRAVLMKYIAFKQIGSISQTAVQNLKLLVDGSQVGATASITNSGSNTNVVIFDLTGSPVTLATGGHTLSLNGDVVTGTSYNFNFTLQQAADAVFYDTSYNVNVPLTWTGGAALFQVSAGTTTINSGTLSVQQDPTFTATQFVKNASQVTLGQWTMKAYGEDVKVQNIDVILNYLLAAGTPVSTSTLTSGDGFNNLSLYVNGGQVGSSLSALNPTLTNGAVTYPFGSTNLFTIPAGTTVTVAVKGDSVFSTTGPSYWVSSVRSDLLTPQNSLQGVTSYSLTPTGASGVTYSGIALSLTSSSAALAVNTAFSNQTISANVTKQHIGSFVIQANNAEGVRVNSLTVTLSSSTPGSTCSSAPCTVFNSSGQPTGLANLYLVTPDYPNGTTPVNPGVSNAFSVNFTVPANQTATVDVYADVSNVTGNVISTLSGSGVGASSAQAVNLSMAGSGQTITIGSGTLNQPTPQTSSPVASFVIGGGISQPVATFNFTATNGGATIQELDFDTVNASGTAVAITNVTVGGITASMVGASSTVTGLNIAVPANYSGVDVPVTASFAPVGLNGVPTNQQFRLNLIRIKYLAGSTTTYLPPSGLTVEASSNWFDLVGSYPTVTLASAGNTLTTGNLVIGTLTVSANAAGNVKVTAIPFTFASSTGVTADTVSLVDSATGQSTAASAQSIANNAATVLLTADNNIAAGTTKTYNIVVHVTSTGSQTNYSLSVSMGGSTYFLFTDVNGNAGISGAATAGAAYGGTFPSFMTNYPTNSAIAHQ